MPLLAQSENYIDRGVNTAIIERAEERQKKKESVPSSEGINHDNVAYGHTSKTGRRTERTK